MPSFLETGLASGELCGVFAREAIDVLPTKSAAVVRTWHPARPLCGLSGLARLGFWGGAVAVNADQISTYQSCIACPHSLQVARIIASSPRRRRVARAAIVPCADDQHESLVRPERPKPGSRRGVDGYVSCKVVTLRSLSYRRLLIRRRL